MCYLSPNSVLSRDKVRAKYSVGRWVWVEDKTGINQSVKVKERRQQTNSPISGWEYKLENSKGEEYQNGDWIDEESIMSSED